MHEAKEFLLGVHATEGSAEEYWRQGTQAISGALWGRLYPVWGGQKNSVIRRRYSERGN
jgi:hypothetical protein